MENPYVSLLPKEKKSKKVETRLMEGCLNLLESGRSFGTIPVTDLCAAASASRTSFYSCFQNTVDVLHLLEDSIVLNCYHRFCCPLNPANNFVAALNACLDYMESIHRQIKCLVECDLTIRSFVKKFRNAVMAAFYPYLAGKEHLDLYLTCISGAITTLGLSTLENPNKVSRKEVIDTLTDIIRFCLRF